MDRREPRERVSCALATGAHCELCENWSRYGVGIRQDGPGRGDRSWVVRAPSWFEARRWTAWYVGVDMGALEPRRVRQP